MNAASFSSSDEDKIRKYTVDIPGSCGPDCSNVNWAINRHHCPDCDSPIHPISSSDNNHRAYYENYQHREVPPMNINSRNYMDARNLSYDWEDDSLSDESDPNARLRRRREIHHQGKYKIRKRSNGKITPNRSV